MLKACPVPYKPKSAMLCQAFVDGAPKDAEGTVFYGVTEANLRQYLEARKRGPVFMIDNSYFDKVRGKQFRATEDAMQRFITPEMTSDGRRFGLLGIELQPLQPPFPGRGWLFVEQSKLFLQMHSKANQVYEWEWPYVKTRWPAIYIAARRPWDRNKLKQQATLEQALVGFTGVVTHSSAAAVTAAILGLRWHVSMTSALYGINRVGRERALAILADNQWHIDEFREGRTWEWLQRNPPAGKAGSQLPADRGTAR